jgi:hypothetical protein
MNKVISEMIPRLKSILDRYFGPIYLPRKTLFLETYPLRFINKVVVDVEQIERYFKVAIPDELYSLIVAHSIRKRLERVQPYLMRKELLNDETRQKLSYDLDLLFTQNSTLRALRNEPKRLGNQRPHFDASFHGEFSYALLHMLNRHKLYVKEEDKEMLVRIGMVTDTINALSDAPGTVLGWRAALPYGIDGYLPVRKRNFCNAIDDRTTGSPMTTARDWSPLGFERKALQAATNMAVPTDVVTIAIWNRYYNRDASRCLSLAFVKKIINIINRQTNNQPLRLIVLGDKKGLNGLAEWVSQQKMMVHDLRGKHMFKEECVIPKDEQLYYLRDVMKTFDPKIIVGSRSGLVALCALVGRPALQIDLTDASNTCVISRALSYSSPTKPQNASSPLSKRALSSPSPSVESSYTADTRLIEAFARCPVDGLGAAIELTKIAPNTDDVFLPPSEQLLDVTLSVMMMTHDDFQPLALEMLASYLAGHNPMALHHLELILDAYQQSQPDFCLKEGVSDKQSKFDDSNGDDDAPSSDDTDRNGFDKKNGKMRNTQSDSGADMNSGNGSFGDTPPSQSRILSSQYEGNIMDSRQLLDVFEHNQNTCLEYFLALSVADKSALFIDALLNLDCNSFKKLFSGLVANNKDSILRYDQFIIFEYALHSLEHLSFLLQECDGCILEMVTATHLVRHALQLESLDDAKEAVSLIKSSLSSSDWTNLLMCNHCVIPRSMTQHIDANYAWAECQTLNRLEKKEVLCSDNYILFRRAASLEDRGLALNVLESMGVFLSEKAIDAVNAYGGDSVFQAFLKEDDHLVSTYYPLLTEDNRLYLKQRIEQKANESDESILKRYTEFLSTLDTLSHGQLPQLKQEPTSVCEITSPPRDSDEQSRSNSRPCAILFPNSGRSVSLFRPDKNTSNRTPFVFKQSLLVPPPNDHHSLSLCPFDEDKDETNSTSQSLV